IFLRQNIFEKAAQIVMVESIEGECWYHGLRPKGDVAPLFKDVGDWLVRTTEGSISITDERNDVKTGIVLSVMIEAPNKIFNYLLHLNKATNMWVIASTRHLREFATPLELIEYYEENDLPGGYRLLKPVPRPRWMISHSCVHFDDWDLIGRGHFCDVLRGKYNDPFKRVIIDVAIKFVHLQCQINFRLWHGGNDSTRSKREEAHDCMMKEARIMMSYKHRNVVEFYGVACDRPPVMIVMELCPGGNLETHLRKMSGSIMPGERIVYCLEIARGLRYLHRKNCIHGDLACRNCLISKHGEIKVTDFGLSKLVDEITAETKILRPQDRLPVRWMAPETLARIPLYSTKSDVWSYGVVCYEIFNNGEKPWPYLEAKIIAKSYKNGKLPNIPSATPPQIAKMMTRTWHLKTERRPNFDEIIVTLTKAHGAIPPPPPEMRTVFSLEGVIRRTPEEEKKLNDEEMKVTTSASLLSSASSASTAESIETSPTRISAFPFFFFRI
uniref:Tyrosine-protein kinase n=2 Tax=Parascaris univalens TaxID=6257 RepID=A0A915AMN7_PARUN